ncbi:MAG: ACT domain-containing protein [Candidatus Polarisedimenticolaceae bacterium]|nr:ACT domain-containing protein [Candidatus Polarisedimenticolaceae bacterium]
MNNWKMVTLVGEDQPGIVAQTTEALYQNSLTLGETSMMRLGGNFSMMMMVSGEGDLSAALAPVAQALNLRLHIDDIAGRLHQHLVPNIQIRVMGADQPGIVARVTGALAASGFNILELESDVAGTAQEPVYIMTIQGISDATVETLQQAVDSLSEEGVDVSVSAIETLFA